MHVFKPTPYQAASLYEIVGLNPWRRAERKLPWGVALPLILMMSGSVWYGVWASAEYVVHLF
jgi:hypothetical protein